jgi:hypothetical protein
VGILKRVRARAFYKDALTEGEKERLPAARKMEGLDEEIAMLRVRLFTAVKDHPKDLPLLLAGVGMLVRAVATQYRLSPKARKDLANRMTDVLNSLGDQFLPADA